LSQPKAGCSSESNSQNLVGLVLPPHHHTCTSPATSLH